MNKTISINGFLRILTKRAPSRSGNGLGGRRSGLGPMAHARSAPTFGADRQPTFDPTGQQTPDDPGSPAGELFVSLTDRPGLVRR